MKKDGECCLGDTVALDDGILLVVAERIDVHSSLSPGTRSGMTNCLWSDLKHHHLLNNIPWRDSSFFCGPIDIHWPRMAQLAAAAVALNKKTNFGNDTGHFFTNLYSLLCLWSTVASAWSSGNEYYVLRILHKPTLARFNWKTQVSHTNLCNAY